MTEARSAADRIEVRRVTNDSLRPHSLIFGGMARLSLSDDEADLFDEVLAAARNAEELRGWKDSALHVLGQWEAVYEALGSPGPLGRSKAANALDEVDCLLAAARNAPDPLPEGFEHTVMATGEAILREGWQWRFSAHEESRIGYDSSSGGPFPDARYECRPPQQPTTERVPWSLDLVGRRLPNGAPIVSVTAAVPLVGGHGKRLNVNGDYDLVTGDGYVEVLTEGGDR